MREILMNYFSRSWNIHRWVQSPFLRHNIVLFAGSFITALLNYLFYPLLAKIMDVVSFGETQILISIFMQLTIIFTVTSVVITNIVATDTQGQHENKALIALENFMALIVAVGFLALLVFSREIGRFFQLERIEPIYLLAGALLITFPLTINQAYLRGVMNFRAVTLGGVVGALSKLLLAIMFVFLGFRTLGALLGLLLAQMIAWVLTAVFVKRNGLRVFRWNKLAIPQMSAIREQLRYGLFVMLVTLVISFQYTIDSLIVKRLFDPVTAGHYAGISTVTRILFFLTASIASVLFSSIKPSNAARHNLQMLLASILLVLGLGGLGLLVLAFLPGQAVTILMGEAYLELVYLLPKLATVVFLVSLTNVLLTYSLALRWYGILKVVLLGAWVTGGLLLYQPINLDQIVQNLLVGNLSLLVLVSGWIIWKTRSQITPFGALETHVTA